LLSGMTADVGVYTQSTETLATMTNLGSPPGLFPQAITVF